REALDGDRVATAVAGAADVHRAAGVVADERGGAGGLDAGGLVVDHAAGDRGVLGGEGAAEAAALLDLVEGAIVEALDLLDEALRLVAHAQVAEVARGVVGGGAAV